MTEDENGGLQWPTGGPAAETGATEGATGSGGDDLPDLPPELQGPRVGEPAEDMEMDEDRS